MTVAAAAEALEWSEAKMWRIETGNTSLRSLDVDAMCRIYGAADHMRVALMGLAKETKAKGWWHAYGDVIPGSFDLYVGLEEATASLDQYAADLIPGLLQTPEYHRAVLGRNGPDLTAEEVDRLIRVRTHRQAIITRVTSPPSLHYVLGEAVVRHQVGGPDVMTAQLSRLAEMNQRPNVSLRLLPFGVGAHMGLDTGSFIVMRFPKTGDGRDHEPPTVYVQGFTGALYLDKPHEVDRYADAFAEIWSDALPETDSAALLQQIAREMQES